MIRAGFILARVFNWLNAPTNPQVGSPVFFDVTAFGFIP